MRRRKKPNIYRFLKPFVAISVPAIIILAGMKILLANSCAFVQAAVPKAACTPAALPLLGTALWVLISLGVLCSAYLAHRDFVRGQYYLDLEEP